LSVTGVCCPAGQIPQPDGSCAKPPPPPKNSCQQSGNSLYCAPIPNVLCKLGHAVAGGCCPPGSMPQGNACVATGPSCGLDATICCPAGQAPNFATGQCCPAGLKLVPGVVAPGCTAPPPPPPPGGACLQGYVKLGATCCQPNQLTSSGQCCPAGQSPAANGTCQSIIHILGCPGGQTFNLHTHICDPQPACPAGLTRSAAGFCACPAGQKLNAAGKCVAACSGSDVMNPLNGGCERKTAAPPPPLVSCALGYVLGANGMCQRVTTPPPPPGTFVPPPTPPPPGTFVPAPPIPTGPGPCPPGEERTERGCVPVAPACPAGEVMGPRGCEKPVVMPTCPAGEVMGPRGCEKPAPIGCSSGEERNAAGACVTIPRGPTPGTTESCPAGEVRTARGCEKETITKPVETLPKLNIEKLPPRLNIEKPPPRPLAPPPPEPRMMEQERR